MTKQHMNKQDPGVRRHNFKEVATGFTEEQALAEASRCLECKKPLCVEGCPVRVQIPQFIHLIKEKKYVEGAKKIKETNSFPAVCGRVCPQEDQCEGACILNKKGNPIGIGYLERFVADALEKSLTPARLLAQPAGRPQPPLPRGEGASKVKKVAVIGTGPAGLTCAADLAKLGYSVRIFEALHDTGGVMRYGIPEFRLPKRIVDFEVKAIKELGVEIELNAVIGATLSIEDLFKEGYQAVFIGVGAGTPSFMSIPGENLNGVYSANEFLTRVNLMKSYDFPKAITPIKIGKHVAVVGGGNVAMDAARTAMRLGAEKVYLVYRRSRTEMPARIEEVENAEEEGIIFKLLTNPKKIMADSNGSVSGMECIQMELGVPDDSGRRRPVEKAGSEFMLAVQTVIMAIGTQANPLLTKHVPGLDLNKWGYIVADEQGRTSVPGVYAGGDIVTGSATVIQAMGAGRAAAKSIEKFLSK
mgnify:CR=1 FL=1